MLQYPILFILSDNPNPHPHPVPRLPLLPLLSNPPSRDTNSNTDVDSKFIHALLHPASHANLIPLFHHSHGYQAGKYNFPNDDKELNRMDIEHQNQLLQLDNKLHLAPLQDPKAILDLGTGTGIWAIEVRTFPQEHTQDSS